MGPLGTTNSEYEVTTKKYRVSVTFFCKLGIFRKRSPMYFERKFDFFKTSKNTNMGPLGTTNPEYGTHNTEI
jgi:hypothetical protein